MQLGDSVVCIGDLELVKVHVHTNQPNLALGNALELGEVINVKIENPEFEGQTKQKLGNSEVKGAVEKVINEQLMIYFELHPDGAKSICEKAVLAQQAREAARKAREQTRRKTAMESNSLPGKLADCSSKNADECEIFIVEGETK